VVVTDFTCGSGYVFELQTRKDAPPPRPDQAGWGKAWIPLFSKSPNEKPELNPAPRRFVVLLETSPTNASGQGFHMLSRQQAIEGLATPLARSNLDAEVRSKLAVSYSDTDFQNCLVVVQYERYEKDDASVFATALAIGAFGGFLVGLPTMVFGIIATGARWRQQRFSKAENTNASLDR
jgi:hypothetical protein